MAAEPFKVTSISVDRIVKAIASDPTGNLIFSDILNPDGVTLTELIKGLVASNVSFDSSGAFFIGASNVKEALESLNQFAYLNDTGRFIYVDPTIDDSLTVSGQIYNDLQTALTYASNQTTNGYNRINVLLMGSHKVDADLDINNDLGAYEFDNDTFESIDIQGNGLKIIGIGNPIIRFNGVSGNKDFFVIEDSTTVQETSIHIQDVHFEFINSSGVSAIKVANAPLNINVKDRSGLVIDGISASFVIGNHENNRIIDISNTSPKKSNIKIRNIWMGSIADSNPSSTPIELIYIDHHNDTVVNIDNFDYVNFGQPNETNNSSSKNVTSLTAIKCLSGKLNINNARLDEKMLLSEIHSTQLMKMRVV